MSAGSTTARSPGRWGAGVRPDYSGAAGKKFERRGRGGDAEVAEGLCPLRVLRASLRPPRSNLERLRRALAAGFTRRRDSCYERTMNIVLVLFALTTIAAAAWA